MPQSDSPPDSATIRKKNLQRLTQKRFTVAGSLLPGPREPWQAGEYSLIIDTSLEDVAGNRIGRPFEVDAHRPAAATDEPKTAVLKFRVH